MGLTIRFATASDVSTILRFIRALAEFERLSHQCEATEADLERTLFGAHPAAEVLIAELDGEPVGFALFFHNYSTFLAKPGLYLEDLFVLPEARAQGVGKALLRRLAQIAQERGCGRMEWWVLDWNTRAIEFYRSLGATAMSEWTVFRLERPQIERLASAAQA